MKNKTLFIGILLMLTYGLSFAAEFQKDTLYSRWIIDSRISDFRNKSRTSHFKTESTERNVAWDYVPGLVAKAIIMAWEQYQDEPWSESWFASIEDYADHTPMHLGYSNIDDLNAGKIFFELYRGAMRNGDNAKAAVYKEKASLCRYKLKYEHTRIADHLPGSGGFWHKKQYVNQMWLDGLYMGPSLYAEWQRNFGETINDKDNVESWNDIVMQFDTIFHYTWDAEKKLCYHAWSAEPQNKASSFWADPETGLSQEFWARGMGWFFAALVDVVGFMPETHPKRANMVKYTQMVAEGLKARQDDKTGCWFQLLQYDESLESSCGVNNYIESSASSMFTYAFLKAVRLGVISKEYLPVAKKAYRGLIEQFVVEEDGGTIKLIRSCESAGLSSSRKGDADYYLCGKDVPIHDNTEGKVLGPFIMASLEFEKLNE